MGQWASLVMEWWPVAFLDMCTVDETLTAYFRLKVTSRLSDEDKVGLSISLSGHCGRLTDYGSSSDWPDKIGRLPEFWVCFLLNIC